MINLSFISAAVAAFSVLFLVHIILKTSHPFAKSLKSSLFGAFGIIFMSASSVYTGVSVPLNLVSIGLAAILGLPGIGTLMILNTLLTY